MANSHLNLINLDFVSCQKSYKVLLLPLQYTHSPKKAYKNLNLSIFTEETVKLALEIDFLYFNRVNTNGTFQNSRFTTVHRINFLLFFFFCLQGRHRSQRWSEGCLKETAKCLPISGVLETCAAGT